MRGYFLAGRDMTWWPVSALRLPQPLLQGELPLTTAAGPGSGLIPEDDGGPGQAVREQVEAGRESPSWGVGMGCGELCKGWGLWSLVGGACR